jgi:SAM-dependent methyltransferase
MSDSHKIFYFPRVDDKFGVQNRIERTKRIIDGLNVSSILDIGGRDFKEYCSNTGKLYTCIDLERPQKTGQGGYFKDKDGLTYDGRNLPFGENEFDLVIVSFVLHHASNNTLFLLEQIKKISKRYIIIGEDLSELDYDLKWHKRNFIHQPGGVFRSDEEWQILFKLYGLKLQTQYMILRSDDINPRHIYRCLYILEK